MRRSRSVAVVASVMVALVTVTGGSASRGGGAGLIVYSDGGLYVVRSDGAGERRVTSSMGQLESAPSWSPDGKRLVFDSAPDDGSILASSHGHHRLLLATLSNGRVSKLFDVPDVGNCADPEWSPTGGVIAFTHPQGSGIYLISPTGKNLRRIPNTTGRDYAPSWAPGGKHLVFSREGSIWITRIDGRNQRKLTIGSGDASPSWSPDGKAIAFSRNDPEDHRNPPDRNIWVMNTNGTGLRKLTHQRRPTWDPITPREAGDPAWSPRGDRIAFVTTFDGMWLMNPDGTGKRRIAQGFLSEPAWQPN